MSQVEQRAVRAGVSIHIVAAKDRPYQVPQHAGVVVIDPRTTLQRLAVSTGGIYVSMADHVYPEEHVSQIMRVLTGGYVLELADDPSLFGDPDAELRIAVGRPGVNVRVKTRYCAADSCP